MTKQTFSTHLAQTFGPRWVPGKGGMGGHDDLHCIRMERMYDELSALVPNVDREMYATAVWLHNYDRYIDLSDAAKKDPELKKSELTPKLLYMLEESNFDAMSKMLIVDAVLEHGKRDDEPIDSPLLAMLRLADKWDRISMVGITSGLTWKGGDMPAYNPRQFGYGSTAEGAKGWQNHWENFFRILEWYPSFPLIREMVRRNPQRFRDVLYFMRAWARTVAEAHGVENTSEASIKRCLGEYYKDWLP